MTPPDGISGDELGSLHAEPGGPGDAVDGIVPHWVVRPRDAGELAGALRAAAAQGLAVVASGRGAHLAIGGPPARLDLLLRTDRLDRVLDHQAADMTITAQAGCTLAALDAALARAAQWLPLDPPEPAETTVGGLIAASSSGPLRASQGTVRDLLLGIETVSAQGTLLRGGGRVVKNVAGYDLPKLHVGALGSLGVIVAATFKVRPRPPCERALAVDCRSAAQAGELALALRDAVEPLWLEIAGSPAGRTGEAAPHDDGFRVVAGLGGIVEEVEDGLARLEGVARAGRLHAQVLEDGASVRTRLGALAAPRDAAAVLRAATLPTEVGAVLDALAAAARSVGASVGLCAHAASGAVRASVFAAHEVSPLVRRVRPQLEARGESLIVERATAAVKQELRRAGLDVWGEVGSGLQLMRGVKAALDPAGLLAPGRMPGS